MEVNMHWCAQAPGTLYRSSETGRDGNGSVWAFLTILGKFQLLKQRLQSSTKPEEYLK